MSWNEEKCRLMEVKYMLDRADRNVLRGLIETESQEMVSYNKILATRRNVALFRDSNKTSMVACVRRALLRREDNQFKLEQLEKEIKNFESYMGLGLGI